MFSALLFILNAAETIFVPENSLFFKEDKDRNKWEIRNVTQSLYGEVIKQEKFFLERGNAVGVYVDAYHLKIPELNGCLYFPGVTFKIAKEGILVSHIEKIDFLMFIGICIFMIGLAVLAGYIHYKKERITILLPAALVLFFWGYALWYIGFASKSFITPTDEIHYFNIAKKILACDFTSTQYHYTIGFPILCIPFILLFDLQNYMDFVLVFMNFQTFILIPGLFLILYGFFNKKMLFSKIQSFTILLLWLILIAFYMPINGTVNPDDLHKYIPELFYSNAHINLAETKIYFSFIHLTWLGRNAMSDYAAVFLFIVLLYVSMKKSRSLIRFFALSAGFGFICLVRINYIFFAPLLAFIFYDSFSELWKKKWNYLYVVLCGSAGFLIVFGWQFVINIIHFGSPFIWPYSLHKYAPDRGFVWDIVPYGFKVLCRTNYIYIILGISSLFFIPERKTRVLLSLWIFPMLLFFFGYPIVFNNPVRFIFALYPPLMAAIVMNPVWWKSAWHVRIKAALVVISSSALCKSDVFFIHCQPWNLEKYGISNTSFMIIQSVICLFCCGVIFSLRKELKTDYANTIRHFRFLILYSAVFFLGSVCIYISGILVAAAFVLGMWDTWNAIRQIYEKNGSAAQSLTE